MTVVPFWVRLSPEPKITAAPLLKARHESNDLKESLLPDEGTISNELSPPSLYMVRQASANCLHASLSPLYLSVSHRLIAALTLVSILLSPMVVTLHAKENSSVLILYREYGP